MLAPIALGVKFQMACLLMSLICKMPPLYIWVLCMFNLISLVSRFVSEMWWFYFHYASRNMAFNKLNQNIPHSLPNLKRLRHLWVANLLTTFFAYLVYDYSSVISSFLCLFLSFFWQESVPQYAVWTHWQCVYWPGESKRVVCFLSNFLHFKRRESKALKYVQTWYLTGTILNRSCPIKFEFKSGIRRGTGCFQLLCYNILNVKGIAILVCMNGIMIWLRYQNGMLIKQ